MDRYALWTGVVAAGLAAWAACGAGAPATAPPPAADGAATAVEFRFRLDKDAALTGAGILDAGGRLVRQLWALKPLAAGEHTAAWDGRDEYGRPAAPGKYEYRVVANRSLYRNVGIIGNSARPAGELHHIQSHAAQVVTDTAGNIYTANGWEEAGHDFKVMGPDGQTRFHARYQIRNGNPNGAPYSIAVDDAYIYCGMGGWASEQWKSAQQIQRFRIADGTHETFTGLTDHAGHIQLYEWPERQVPPDTPEADAALMRAPIRALAIVGETIFAADALAGSVRKYHKVTGAAQGEFAVRLPMALAADREGRLWVGHEHTRISVFDTDGARLAEAAGDIGRIASLCFGPDGRLYVADAKACQIRIYEVSGTAVKPAGVFGQPAKPGDFAPDRFYQLHGAAVDADGHLVTIAGLPTGGARIARFSPDGKCLWEHHALLFCDLGKYAPDNPEEFITHRLHRIALTDPDAGLCEYRGTLLDGDPRYIEWQHGVLRFADFAGRRFIGQCYGDGIQFYRRTDQGTYRLCAMLGGRNPWPDGTYDDKQPQEKRRPLRQWTWTDQNGDATPQDEEVVYYKPPWDGRYVMFGANIDAAGAILYCEHHSRAVWELPLAGLDGDGNPVYDWRLARIVIPADTSPGQFHPLMALRHDDGTIYAFARSGTWPQPKNLGAWMGGWALIRYSRDGQMLWAARLPEVCVGMDAVPGGGVMLGWYEQAVIYHYGADGLLIGSMAPGEAAGNVSGWMDNTSAVAVCRNPRDGQLDVFGEDSWLNRLLWYRVDDRGIQTLTGHLTLATPAP